MILYQADDTVGLVSPLDVLGRLRAELSLLLRCGGVSAALD